MLYVIVLPVVIAGVMSTIGTYIGYPTVLGAVGFTEAGVAAGSIAAAVQVQNYFFTEGYCKPTT